MENKYIIYSYNYKEDTIPDYIAYTDGSCNNLSPFGEGGSAYVIIQNDEVIKKCAKGFIHTTNNRMELLAIISAIASVPLGSSVQVYTDSQYCILTFQAKKPKKNLDLLVLFHNAIKGRKVCIKWIKGHNDTFYNELCDALADEQTESMRKTYNIPLYDIYNSPKVKKRKR